MDWLHQQAAKLHQADGFSQAFWGLIAAGIIGIITGVRRFVLMVWGDRQQIEMMRRDVEQAQKHRSQLTDKVDNLSDEVKGMGREISEIKGMISGRGDPG